ncbi:hypothetical protein MtrunA17_Chr3g0082491 [Medicago truncatula]|uniref:Uncharacterized protein n=1 Tax=Medicago truncatula TaxID=3880 RepID=A0A396IJA6_MEDTR|nr:hypothetical protein MtrunA17_Chr3g0082491 [Medicago truncatula]
MYVIPFLSSEQDYPFSPSFILNTHCFSHNPHVIQNNHFTFQLVVFPSKEK